MTVEKLRKAAEDYIEARASSEHETKKHENNHVIHPAPVEIWKREVRAKKAYEAALTPERVLALCELARVMDDTHLIARQSPDWPGERFLNGTDEGTLALEALADIEAAFGESEDD